ncbi:MAG: DNA cytosine methyltransferase [Treponema sp.]
MKNIVAIDLFSGAGGTTSGLKKAGIKVVAAIEIDKWAAQTYRFNNPEVVLFEDDIRTISGKKILDAISLESSNKLLLVACPPCQGFSTIGKKDINDKRNQLIFEYLRLIKELEPDFLLMENVSGIINKKNGLIFTQFINLIKSEYLITYEILNTADYGVPQTRKRLVLHGIKKDKIDEGFEIKLPKKTHSKEGKKNTQKWVTAEVIMDLPEIKSGEEFLGEGIYNHISNKLTDINIKRIRYIRENGGNRSSLPDNLTLNCHKKNKGHGDVYGIIDISKPSVTITGGCMTYSKGRFGHPTQDRALSAREAARLQSFDDSYVFLGNKGELAKQIGNAVPVKLAEASGRYFRLILSEVK